jgi:hypothetical protein
MTQNSPSSGNSPAPLTRGAALRRAVPLILLAVLSAGCEPGGAPEAGTESPAAARLQFQLAGRLRSDRLDEASGIQAGADGTLYLHDDEGTRLFVADPSGRYLRDLDVKQANNRDWEDITRVPGADGPLLVIGDIGDNHTSRRNVSLYFVPEPQGEGDAVATHRVRITYPDGPRDAESLAYDADGGRLLILSKRDQPPRLYGVPLDLALWKQDLEAEFLGEVPGLRPPTRTDILRNPGRGLWVSQPTGMDISPDGRRAAVITYRSLYLFERAAGEGWAAALSRPPQEIVGPPGTQDEGVAFSADGRSVLVTAEGSPTPVWRLDLPGTQQAP